MNLSLRMIYRTLFLVLLALLAGFMPQQLQAAAKIEGIRMADRKEFTRFVADIEGLKEYKVFTLENPPRLVIDIKNSKWGVPKDNILKARSRLVKNMRHGVQDKNTVRMVLDLMVPLKSKEVFVVPAGKDSKHPRLVVDFAAAGKLPARAVESAPTPQKQTASTPALPTGSLPLSMQYAQQKGLQETNKNTKFSSVPTPQTRPQDMVKRAKIPVVVIDPGHGGVDPGAIGRASKTREKDITFKYAIALKNELEKTGRYKVVLTRRGDYYINLRKRIAIAREAKGDIFISLHADSHPNPTTRGLSVYTLSEKASDREAAALAKRANQEDVIEGIDLKDEPKDVKEVLIEMTQRDTKNLSSRFAEILVKEVGQEAKLLRNSHRFAGFVVLKGVDIPSVLVELGYLSNRREETLLRTEAYKTKLVRAMVKALDKYFK